MKNQKINEMLDTIREVTNKESPNILTGMALAGLVVTTIMAFRAAPKAKEIIEAHEKDESKKEMIKEVIPVVAPVAGMGMVTGACILGSNRIAAKRIALLSTAYTLTESAMKDYQNAMIVFGEIRDYLDSINKKHELSLIESLVEENIDVITDRWHEFFKK